MRSIRLRLSVFAVASVCSVLSGCAAEESEAEAPVASGTLMVSMASNNALYGLKQADGTYVSLNVEHMRPTTLQGTDEAIDWRSASGSPVEVFGTWDGDVIEVDAMQPPDEPVSMESAISANGSLRILALPTQFSGGPVIATKRDIQRSLDVVVRRLEEASFGKLNVTYDIADPIDVPTSCEFYTWMDNAVKGAKAHGVDVSKYQDVLVVGTPTGNGDGCQGWAGVGSIGLGLATVRDLEPSVVVHELGHNFVLQHAAAEVCSQNGSRVTMARSCNVDEYGDPFDVMGHGGAAHYNAQYKAQMGWIPPSQVKTISGDQTLTLAPMTAPSDKPQLLRIPGPDDIVYTVEFHQPSPENPVAANDPSVNGVLIHVLRTRSGDRRDYARLLDMNPGGQFRDAPLGVGKSHTFFGTNTTLKVLSVSAEGARLQITGAPDGGGTGDDGENLVSVMSRKCVGVQGASKTNGAAVVQWTCNGSSDQAWKFESIGGGKFIVKDVNSGRCLDVNRASKQDGAEVIQWDCHRGTNQQWTLVDKGAGKVSLRSVNSGMCLDTRGAATSNGARFVQTACKDRSNQQFERR